MSPEALRDAGISPTTVRISVGQEDPRGLVAHLVAAAQATFDDEAPGFSRRFPPPHAVDEIYRRHFLDVHRRFVENLPTCAELME
jgi:hypothetical protein